MLLLHPTKKVLNIARIIPETDELELPDPGPLNEWYVDIVGLGIPGKNALLFVHRTTYVAVIVSGKSLEKAVPVFKERLKRLLLRYHNDVPLLEKILKSLDPVVIQKTNDRKTLGIINHRKHDIQAIFYLRFDANSFSDWDVLEDDFLEYPHKPREGRRDYSSPGEELRKVLAGKGW
jgi:hypothetical protein